MCVISTSRKWQQQVLDEHHQNCFMAHALGHDFLTGVENGKGTGAQVNVLGRMSAKRVEAESRLSWLNRAGVETRLFDELRLLLDAGGGSPSEWAWDWPWGLGGSGGGDWGRGSGGSWPGHDASADAGAGSRPGHSSRHWRRCCLQRPGPAGAAAGASDGWQRNPIEMCEGGTFILGNSSCRPDGSSFHWTLATHDPPHTAPLGRSCWNSSCPSSCHSWLEQLLWLLDGFNRGSSCSSGQGQTVAAGLEPLGVGAVLDLPELAGVVVVTVLALDLAVGITRLDLVSSVAAFVAVGVAAVGVLGVDEPEDGDGGCAGG